MANTVETTIASSRTESIAINPCTLVFPRPLTKIVKNNVRWIVIHHSGGQTLTPESCHRIHIVERGFNGAAYNFLVRKDGSIWELRGEQHVGAHAAPRENGPGEADDEPFNSYAMGICFEGMYDLVEPSSTQLAAGVKLCAYLMGKFPNLKYDVSKIVTHNWTISKPGAKSCPGYAFPMTKLRTNTREKLATTAGVAALYQTGSMGQNTSEVVNYVVRAGDTLESIAKAFGVPPLVIKGLNMLTGGVVAGMTLVCPNTMGYAMVDAILGTNNFMSNLVANAKYAYDTAVTESVVFGDEANSSFGYKYGRNSGVFAQNQELLRAAAEGSKPSLSKFQNTPQTILGSQKNERGYLEPVKTPTSYNKFRIMIDMGDHLAVFMFKIDPVSASDSRSRNLSEVKTKGGSIIVDNGPNFANKTLNGVMLDYNGKSEKTEFLDFYESYIASGNYKAIYLDFLGVFSMVEIHAVNTSESGVNNMMKNYSISIMVLAENTGAENRNTYDQNAMSSVTKIGSTSKPQTEKPNLKPKPISITQSVSGYLFGSSQID